MLRVALVGRLVAADIDLIEQALTEVERPFGVVLDRTRLGAPTADGRSALERWAAGPLVDLQPRIVAWADVYDERRFRSLTRDGQDTGRGPGYPQRTFADLLAAEAWVRGLLAAAREGSGTE